MSNCVCGHNAYGITLQGVILVKTVERRRHFHKREHAWGIELYVVDHHANVGDADLLLLIDVQNGTAYYTSLRDVQRQGKVLRRKNLPWLYLLREEEWSSSKAEIWQERLPEGATQ